MTINTTDKRNINKIPKLLKNMSSKFDNIDFMLSEFVFTSTKTKSFVKCKKHGLYKQSLYRLARGFGCLRCASAKNNRNVHGVLGSDISYNKNNIKVILDDNTKYVLSDIVTYECSTHGQFTDTLSKTRNKGTICKRCKEENPYLKRWKEECKKIHNNKYDYSLINSIDNCFQKVKIICPVHGIFEQQLNNHKFGEGCKQCGYIATGKKNSILLKGTKLSDARKLQQSVTMKNLISSGKFTPCVTNSWAKSRSYVDNIPFRSSWEAMFYLVMNLPYEKIRIPYIGVDKKKHNYIVDFHDNKNKILYEIKPICNKIDKTVLLKESAAREWCKERGYKYKFISEDWISINKHNIQQQLYRVNDDNTKRLINKYIN